MVMDKKPSAKSGALNDLLPVGGEADVVVIGSGPSGIAASIAASRKGANVILVERYPFVGGMSTLIPIATWSLNTAVETGAMDMPYDGILGEILDKMKALDAIELHKVIEGVDKFVPIVGDGDKVDTSHWYLFNPEALKYLSISIC